jgi:hypothetical protein
MIEVERIELKNKVVFYIKGTYIYHREDGPAIEYSDGSKEWLINGNHHREDGPAIEWYDGEAEWCLNDVSFKTKELWFEALTEEQKKKALYSEYFIKG